jgi:hypothetical protein
MAEVRGFVEVSFNFLSCINTSILHMHINNILINKIIYLNIKMILLKSEVYHCSIEHTGNFDPLTKS